MFAMAWGAASLYSDDPLGALICLAAKRPSVTAPLMWPPDRPPIVYASTVIVRPNVSDTCWTQPGVPATPVAQPVPALCAW